MSAPGRLRHRVGAAVARWRLWAPGDRVAVAVSGGLDSVCLLDLLCETRRWHGGSLEVVTVDHGTREASAADADFVSCLAADRALPFQRFDLGLGKRASEQRCRDARYAALESLDVERVALGHHLEDQAETLLLLLVRGTGPRGLSAMSWLRGRYARPLLDVTRPELLAWAEHRGLLWREDATNASDRFLRNRLRGEVFPLLEAIRPGATRSIARSADLAASEGDLLEALLDAEPNAAPGPHGWPRGWIARGPEPLVRRALQRHVPGLGSRHLEAIIAAARAGSGSVALPGGGRIAVRRGRVRWTGPQERSAPLGTQDDAPLCSLTAPPPGGDPRKG